MKRICIVTGTRAEYGQLRWLMEGILRSSLLDLRIVVTGAHLSPEFGLTYKVIEEDGFFIDKKVEMLLSSDTGVGIAKSMGLGLIGFADAFSELRPDLILLLGDRFELLAAASAALVARIPIIHLHGGEVTEGAFDEAIRHSITKMSHLHFVATDEYRRRIIQLGETPNRVFVVGGLGVENISRLKLLSQLELEVALDFRFSKKSLLITFHPVTLECNSSADQLNELLAAISKLEDTTIIFTMPNADNEGRKLFQMIQNFCEKHENAKAFISLGQLRYLSCIKYVDAVVGNSSSGLLEVPSFKKGTINIGDRQRGRIRPLSVIDCEPNRTSILNALNFLYSTEFQEKLKQVKNPYDCGNASDSIIKILEEMSLDGLLKKKFYDLVDYV